MPSAMSHLNRGLHLRAYDNDNDNDNEFLFRRMNRKKIIIHKINLQNKYAYIVKKLH